MRSPIKRDKLPESIADEIRDAIERTGIRPISVAVGISRHGLMSVLAGMSTPAHTMYVATRWQERKSDILASIPRDSLESAKLTTEEFNEWIQSFMA